jgi:hypothetical protein
MASTQSSLVQPSQPSNPDERVRQIDSAAWAVFFIWVGIVMLAGLPWDWFLVGIGVLILGTQVLRRQSNLRIETFSIVIGLIILAAGAWDLLSLPLPLMPIVLIALGAYLLWKTLSTTTAP